jgi:hypothetical protein
MVIMLALQAREDGVSFQRRYVWDVTGARAHSAPYPIYTASPFLGAKRPQRESYHVPITGPEN